MNKKLLCIPPFSHAYYLPKFLKDKNISTMTKISVLFENVFLYFVAGLLFGIEKRGLAILFIVLASALILAPFEWKLINFVRSKIKKATITNWENVVSKKAFYFLQYQLLGYIFLGYFVGLAFAMI